MLYSFHLIFFSVSDGGSFALKHGAFGACGIPQGVTFVLTGGTGCSQGCRQGAGRGETSDVTR